MTDFVQARKIDARARELHLKCTNLIENDDETELMRCLQDNQDVLVSDIIDTNGKTLLHECTFNDSFKCLKVVLEVGRGQLTTP